MLVSSIFSSSHNIYYTVQKANFKFSVTFTLLSANAFNLDWPEILSFGKEFSDQGCSCSVIFVKFTHCVCIINCLNLINFEKKVRLSVKEK